MAEIGNVVLRSEPFDHSLHLGTDHILGAVSFHYSTSDSACLTRAHLARKERHRVHVALDRATLRRVPHLRHVGGPVETKYVILRRLDEQIVGVVGALGKQRERNGGV